MQNETNRWSIFFGEDEIFVKLRFKGLNYHIFTFLIITNFKTDRYVNNFQEDLFGILRLRKSRGEGALPYWLILGMCGQNG